MLTKISIIWNFSQINNVCMTLSHGLIFPIIKDWPIWHNYANRTIRSRFYDSHFDFMNKIQNTKS